MPSTFDTESSRRTYDGLKLRVRVDEVRMPDGAVHAREVVERPEAVAVVVVDGHEVVLLRQYRHPVGRYQLELPAGLVDVEGESQEASARRELAEEVGVEVGDLTKLVRFHNSAGWSDETTTIYLAVAVRQLADPSDFAREAEEADMQVVRLPLAEAVELAERGDLGDAKTLIGLLLARRYLAPP
jgi:8-oxo-dGTP pyrophosphatase MutT (NUDIX family)